MVFFGAGKVAGLGRRERPRRDVESWASCPAFSEADREAFAGFRLFVRLSHSRHLAQCVEQDSVEQHGN